MLVEPKIIVPKRCARCGGWRRPTRAFRNPRRFAPRWARQTQLVNAGNYAQVDDATDGVKVKDNGIVVAGDADPCCCEGTCTDCQSITGATVTFADVVSCCSSGLHNWEPVEENPTVSLGAFDNHVYRLSSQCDSRTTITNNAIECGGSTLHNTIVLLFYDGATWYLDHYLAPPPAAGSGSESIFYGTVTDNLCAATNPLVFDNVMTFCTNGNMGYDGTATVTFTYA